ncbi:T6SS effector BTH_I2691 family protein [Chitiniphilus shinanonensis]|uniref:T6SS effector BTH_I2691 family protein n=1 Tax=Chitiniphilus shinanonensis TaxID=553088 RepID=UPI00306493AF
MIPPTCSYCASTGLALLPVRYTVVPQSVAPALPGWAQGVLDVRSVPLKGDYHYALRTLREGFVYLFYEKGPRGKHYWECFSVTANGELWKQPSAQMARGQSSFACTSTAHNNARMEHLCIEQPEKCGKVWVAFSDHKWSPETLERYAAEAALRPKRFQAIDPAQWINSGKAEHATVATAASLGEVLEYAPRFKEAQLPYKLKVDQISESDATYKAGLLKIVSTRYPWFMRTGKQDHTVKAMQLRAAKQAGGFHPPMLLAVHDAIGMTHELNGYRNEAAGRLQQYFDERALAIHALHSIDTLELNQKNQAADRTQQHADDIKHNAANWYDPATEAQRRQAAQLKQEPERSQELQILNIRQRWASQQVPYPYAQTLNAYHLGLKEPERSRKIAELEQEVEQALIDRDKRVKDEVQTSRDQSWARYEARLDRPWIDQVRKQYERIQAEADPLIDERTQDLVSWLEAPLLIDTFEDYHVKNIQDGVVFEDQVGDCIFGIGSSPSGKKKLDEWVNQAKASVKGNLLWRVIAVNQEGAIDDIDAALQVARMNTPLTTQSFDFALANLKNLQRLADTYKKAQSVANTNAKALRRESAFGVPLKPVNTHDLDKVVISAGDRIFARFKLNQVGDVVGEAVLKHVFLLRAAVDPEDALKLMRTEAAHGRAVRTEILQQLAAADTPEKLILRPGEQAKAIQAQWKALKVKDAANNVFKDARLAAVVGLFEALNFAKLASEAQAKGDAKSVFALAVSGASIAAAMIDVASVGAKALFSDTSWSYQKLKLYGGILSGVTAMAVGVADVVTYTSKKSKQDYGLAYLYLSKALLGMVGGASTIFTSIGYAAPLVQRLTGRAAAGVAVEELGKRAAVIVGARVLGMTIGAWVTVGTLVVHFAIIVLTDDALQEWLELSALGRKRKVAGAFKTAKQQDDALLTTVFGLKLEAPQSATPPTYRPYGMPSSPSAGTGNYPPRP